jgi:hypothetical protein
MIIFNLDPKENGKIDEINSFKFVEKDISEVVQDRDFEQLSVEEKETIIAELHKRWSNTESEIVKCINSFAEKNP